MRIGAQVAAVVLVAALGVSPAFAASSSKQRSKRVALKGLVVGQAYALKKRTAVPVLLTPKTAKRARLKGRAGVLALRAKRVKVKGRKRTRIPTSRLRIGDRFRMKAKVRRAARRAPYWQVAARKLKVKKRSGTLSAAELQALLDALRADLAKLTDAVVGLAWYTADGFRLVGAELASLRADLNALRSDFATLAAQLAAVSAQLAALENDLQKQIDALGDDFAQLAAQLQDVLDDVAALNAAVAALGAELAALQGEVATLTGDLAALTATVDGLSAQLGDLSTLSGSVEELLTGVDPGDLAGALGDLSSLQADLAALEGVIGDSTSGLVQEVGSLSAVVGDAGSGLVQDVALLEAADLQTDADIAALQGEVDAAEGRLDSLEALVSGPGGIEDDLAALQVTVGDASSGLVQQVDGLQSDVDTLCGPTSPLDSLC